MNPSPPYRRPPRARSASDRILEYSDQFFEQTLELHRRVYESLTPRGRSGDAAPGAGDRTGSRYPGSSGRASRDTRDARDPRLSVPYDQAGDRGRAGAGDYRSSSANDRSARDQRHYDGERYLEPIRELMSAGISLIEDIVQLPGSVLGGNTWRPHADQGDSVPVLTLSSPAGGTATAEFLAESLDGRPRTRLEFLCTPLIGDDGTILSSDHVSFAGEPVTKFDPRDRYAGNDSYVTVSVTVPQDLPGGTYSGLVQVQRLPGVRLVVELRVG